MLAPIIILIVVLICLAVATNGGGFEAGKKKAGRKGENIAAISFAV